MSLWDTRERALLSLQDKLKREAEIIDVSFALIDEGIERLKVIESSFARVCGLTVVKVRHLALGSYSLMLDGLAQEAGALLRPLIEAYELLIYFRKDPSRVEQAIQGKLPQPGAIAKKIGGEFQGLRDYLNTHASHFGLTLDSVRHFFDLENLTWRTVQQHNDHVLKTNLSVLFAILMRVAREITECLAVAHAPADEYVERVEQHVYIGLSVFRVEEIERIVK